MKKIKLLIFYPSHVFTMNLRASINFIFIIEARLRICEILYHLQEKCYIISTKYLVNERTAWI